MTVLARVLVLVALAATIGCARGSELTVLESLPEDLYASPTPAPQVGDVSLVRVFFTQGDRLVAVRRQVIGSRGVVESAMADLLLGPTPEELERGVNTAIPPGAEILAVEVSGGLATIDLSKEFELSAEQSVLVLRLGQVVYTLTDLNRVTKVRFEIDGVPVSVIGQDGSLREGPVGREDYPGLWS
ncbi:MAG TPA: GerMN domain-containing protein [Actinomycetota bacterium]|nr:GerMN domain-containing protein [Actinomycetota bacterium]